MRSISLLAGQRPTKATMDRGSERKAPHTGTETRPRLLREAAVRNIGQWASSVREDGPTGCKPLFREIIPAHAWAAERIPRISVG